MKTELNALPFAGPGFGLPGELRPLAGGLALPDHALWVFAQRKSGVVLVLPESCALPSMPQFANRFESMGRFPNLATGCTSVADADSFEGAFWCDAFCLNKWE